MTVRQIRGCGTAGKSHLHIPCLPDSADNEKTAGCGSAACRCCFWDVVRCWSCVLFQVAEAGLDGGDAVLHALEFQRQPALVAGTLQNADALVDGHDAVTQRGAAQPVFARGGEEAVGAFAAGLVKEVLGVDVEGVGCGDGHGIDGGQNVFARNLSK